MAELARRNVMTEVRTELASVEEHNTGVWKAIERRAYKLYELEDFKDGCDQEHWFRAERELTIRDGPLSIENDAVVVRLATEDFPASTLVISVSARSVLIFNLKEDASNDCEGIDRECLRIISLPVEIDAARVTSELNDRD